MTDSYLLDTNILGYIANKKNATKGQLLERQLATIDEDLLFISIITVAEVQYGIKLKNDLTNEFVQQINAVMEKFPKVLDINKHVCEAYGNLRAELFKKCGKKDKKGRMKGKWVEELINPTTGKKLCLQENDIWIAATALTHNLILVTTDEKAIKSFKDIIGEELKVRNWLNPKLYTPGFF